MKTYEEFKEANKHNQLTDTEMRLRYAYYIDGYVDGSTGGWNRQEPRYVSGCDPIPGTCKCGEPINNAEYDICPKCRQEAIEYQRDVNEQL